ncbi:MAG: Hint domain-containing protein [Paracoccus sp. (in: a-proteobacteria)]
MPEYTYTRVYALSEVNWNFIPPQTAANNGVTIGTTFTVTGAGNPMTLLDDDEILEDNTNGWNGTNWQTRDDSQQTLVGDFGLNHDGDYIWSRAFQTVVDAHGNVGRIYQIRISEWQPGDPGLPDSGANMHTYYAFSGPLQFEPGETFTILTGFDGFGNQPHPEFEEPFCFGSDTLIDTEAGQIPAGCLTVGMQVRTRDHGWQPVRWIGRRSMTPAEMAAAPNLRPIRIRAGALGAGLPTSDVLVSPQHRVLVRSSIAQRLFGTQEVLVAAKQLLALEGIEVAQDVAEVTYVHFMFDAHQIVFANGAEMESFYAGQQALRGVGESCRAELCEIFPELGDATSRPARPLVEGRMARKLAARHARNSRALVSTGRLN